MIGVLITAWLDVRSKPLRTLAAIGGMVAAVTAVILVNAATTLSEHANTEYIATVYGRTATLSVFAPGDGRGPTSQSEVEVTRLVTLLADNGVSRVTTDVDIGLILVNGDRTVDTRGRWVSSEYPEVAIVDLAVGAFPDWTARAPAPRAVITSDMAQWLGYTDTTAVGATVWFAAGLDLSGADLRVTPLRPLVIDAVATSLGRAAEGRGILLVSDNYWPELTGGRGMSWLIHVNPADVGFVTRLLESANFGAGSRQSELMVRRIDQGAELAPVFDQQRVTAAAVTVVALLVGGLGILGVGLASVRERSKDFGLRRALGASKRLVFAGVVTQTLLEVLLAAVIAVPLAAIVVELFARQLVLASLPLPASTDLPLSSALRGFLAALTVGLLAGFLPALRAARASVIQALRD